MARSARRRHRLAVRRRAAAAPDPERHPEEIWGCEDPRLTWLPEREEWAIAYTAYSRRGPLVSLAMTRDFRTVTRLGPVMPPEDKDAALFPRRIDGRWAMIHRPSPLRGGAHMWISYSPDLRHWGDHALLLEARDGAWWDAGKIGLGPPPLETDDGWLVMYHGVHLTGGRPDLPGRPRAARPGRPDASCCAGATSGCSARTRRTSATGDVDQVVFPCGWVARSRRPIGCCSTTAPPTPSIGVATARFSEVLARVMAAPGPG